jgi:DMSO/TMAO reductase YedYZ molybdopterin-dependent catalytic subunit
LETDDDRKIEARLTRRALLWSVALASGGLIGLDRFNKLSPKDANGLPSVFNATNRFGESVAKAVLPPGRGRDRNFVAGQAVEPRNNYHGNTPEIDLGAWRLDWHGRKLSLMDIKTLPEVTQVTELKCVEGWSTVVSWTGVRFSDFLKAFPDTRSSAIEPSYVALRSEPEGYEDDWYYVGIDLESMLNPQTLLAYGMNGKPLTPEHGAPLRLAIPHKYGIKNIKLITQIALASERPADYWAELGYDWYAGL